MKKAFTLIEMIVVIGVTALIVPLLVSIVISIMQAQIKVLHLTQVKRQGDTALTVMRTLIKNSANTIYNANTRAQVCNKPNSSYSSTDQNYPGSDFLMIDKYNNSFDFTVSEGVIASSSAIINASDNLTDNNVYISNFKISCQKTTSYSPASVTLSFSICYPQSSKTSTDIPAPGQSNPCSSLRNEEVATLDYSTTVKLSNY